MFRRYTDADHAACIEILASNAPRYFSTQDCEDFRAFLAAPLGIYSVLEDLEGVVIGCGGISTRKQEQESILTWGMIHAARHRQGWGNRITLARLSQLSKIDSLKIIRLNTSQETVGFYKKLGFRITAHTPNGYGAGLDCYSMELAVDEKFRQLISKRSF